VSAPVERVRGTSRFRFVCLGRFVSIAFAATRRAGRDGSRKNDLTIRNFGWNSGQRVIVS
jgi:hypothetical protein